MYFVQLARSSVPGRTLLAIGTAAGVTVSGCRPQPPPEVRVPPAYDATFAFTGTVVRTGEVTMPVVPASENTLVVRVEFVLKSPAAGPDIAGREITLHSEDPATLPRGAQAVFLADGRLLGDGVALREVRRLALQDTAGLRDRLAAADQVGADSALLARLDSAELVVHGSIAAVSDTVVPPRRITEHDPMWRAASLAVEEVLKGQAEGQVRIFFPSSRDVAWYEAPKPRVRERAIFLLHSDEILDALTLRDSLDMLPERELARVRRLLGERR